MNSDQRARVPPWIKLGFTAWVVVLIPNSIHYQGVHNFLWFSDIALFTTCAARWLENRLLASMAAVALSCPTWLGACVFSRV